MITRKLFEILKVVSAIILAILALYMLSYAGLSISGGYWMEPDLEGVPIIVDGRDCVLWQPRFGYASGSKADPIGKVYRPLIILDRAFLHKSWNLSDPNLFQWLKTGDLRQIHPRWRAEVGMSRKSSAQKGASAE